MRLCMMYDIIYVSAMMGVTEPDAFLLWNFENMHIIIFYKSYFFNGEHGCYGVKVP